MTQRKILTLLAVLLAVSATGAVLAAAPSQRPAAPRMDANGDGLIDRQEAAAHSLLAQRFDALDKNKDGKLSKHELPFGKGRDGRREAHRSGPRGDGGGFGKLDADKDGRISRAEAAGKPQFVQRFEQMDANKDGFIDKADRELRMKQRTDAWFAAADTDKDGKLSRAEMDASRSQRMQDHGMEHRGMRMPAPTEKEKPAN